jgi:hypothetical protein
LTPRPCSADHLISRFGIFLRDHGFVNLWTSWVFTNLTLILEVGSLLLLLGSISGWFSPFFLLSFFHIISLTSLQKVSLRCFGSLDCNALGILDNDAHWHVSILLHFCSLCIFSISILDWTRHAAAKIQFAVLSLLTPKSLSSFRFYSFQIRTAATKTPSEIAANDSKYFWKFLSHEAQSRTPNSNFFLSFEFPLFVNATQLGFSAGSKSALQKTIENRRPSSRTQLHNCRPH